MTSGIPSHGRRECILIHRVCISACTDRSHFLDPHQTPKNAQKTLQNAPKRPKTPPKRPNRPQNARLGRFGAFWGPG